MGQIAVPKQFDFVTIPDKELAQKIRPLIDYVNAVADQTVRNVNGELTLVTNVKAQRRVVALTHNVETSIDFLGFPKTENILVVNVSDFDALLSLRRKIDSKNQLVLKPTFADASTTPRSVTLYLLP